MSDFDIQPVTGDFKLHITPFDPKSAFISSTHKHRKQICFRKMMSEESMEKAQIHFQIINLR